MSPTRDEIANELRALLHASVADIQEVNRYIAKEDSPFWRRIAYRTIFASIDALASHLKQSALLFTGHRPDIFSESERFALRDVEYAVEDTGRVVERRAKIRFLPNVCFALTSYARAIDKQYTVKKNEGWDALTKGVKVRDRITHPKTALDYDVSDPEVRWMMQGWEWFGESLVDASSIQKQGEQGSPSNAG